MSKVSKEKEYIVFYEGDPDFTSFPTLERAMKYVNEILEQPFNETEALETVNEIVLMEAVRIPLKLETNYKVVVKEVK
jgi:hypothetical protein